MIKLSINPRFEKQFDTLLPGVFIKLEDDLLDDLTTEPIFYWHNPATDQDELIDGHHRYQIAQKHNLELATHEKFFESENEALTWVIYHQLARRNLTPEERKASLNKAVELAKTTGTTNHDAVKQVAEVAQVSKATVYRAIQPEPEPEPEHIETTEDRLQADIEAFKAKQRDFELRVQKRKLQAIKEMEIRARIDQTEPDEQAEAEITEQLEKEFEAEQEELTTRSDELQEKLAEQRRVGIDKPKPGIGGTKKRKFSHKKEAINAEKKALRAILTTGGHFQKAIIECEEYLSIIVPFRDIFERVEKRLVEMDAGKKKFGRR